MTQLQLPNNAASQGAHGDLEACQQSLVKALRCRMILQNLHCRPGQRQVANAASDVRKRLDELERQIDDAREQLAAFGRWH